MSAEQLDLAAIRARAEAATPGPWRWAGNTDTGEPRLTSRGCDVLAIGWEARSTTGRAAEEVRSFAADSGLDEDAEVELWAHDQYGEPIREPRLWFYTDHMADAARDRVVYEVAPAAVTREDPAVYRADIVGVRHPDAEHIAGMDPSTTLALVAEVERLREVVDATEQEWGVRFPSGNVESYGDDEAKARRFSLNANGLRPDLPTLVVRKTVTAWAEADV